MENLPRQFGRYELIAQLGKGGFATVYHARDQHLLREVAIKILHAHLAIEPAIVERFKREAEAAAQLSHPNIITIHDCGVQDGHIYIVMGLVIGQSVDELLKTQSGSLPQDQALSILRQVASALDYAHSHQLVHRDIKPSNILIDEHGLVTLTDFGLVKALTHQNMTLTGLGEIAGTPAYLAPEQAEPNRSKDIGPAADIYSLGVLAYRLLTGKLPFTGNIAAVLYGHIRQAPPDPKIIETTLSPFISHSLLRALAKKPNERYQSAGQFVAALTSPPSSLPERWAVLPLYAKLFIPFATAVLCIGVSLGTISYMGQPIAPQIANLISAAPQTPTAAISPTKIVIRVTATKGPIQHTATTTQALASNAASPTESATATEEATATESATVTKTPTAIATKKITATESATATQTKTATATKRVPTSTKTTEASPSPTEQPTERIANTAVPTLFVPTATPFIPTKTSIPPTNTPLPPTETFIPPTDVPLIPTETPLPPTEVLLSPTEIPITSTELDASSTELDASSNESEIIYPAPRLIGPDSGITISRRQPLRWDWDGRPLQADEHFDVRIWRDEEAYTSVVWEKALAHEYDPTSLPAGEYYWSVVIIREVNGYKDADLSPEPAPLRFINAPIINDGGGNNPSPQGDNNNGENPPPQPPQENNNGENPPPQPPQENNNGENPPPQPPQENNNGENPPPQPPQEGNNNDGGGNDNGGGGNNNGGGRNDNGGGRNDNGGGGNNNDGGGNDNGGGGNNNGGGGNNNDGGGNNNGGGRNDNGGGGNNNDGGGNNNDRGGNNNDRGGNDDGGGRGQNPPPTQP